MLVQCICKKKWLNASLYLSKKAGKLLTGTGEGEAVETKGGRWNSKFCCKCGKDPCKKFDPCLN